MQDYIKKPESQSRTLDRSPKASRQVPIDVILQQYEERYIQRYAQDKELVQGEFESVLTGEQKLMQQEDKPQRTSTIASQQNLQKKDLFLNSLVQKRTIQLLTAFIDINGRVTEGENGNTRRPDQHAERLLWSGKKNAIENGVRRQETIVNIGTAYGAMAPCEEYCRPYFSDEGNAKKEILNDFPDGVPNSMTFSLGTEDSANSKTLADPPLEQWVINIGDKPAPIETKSHKKTGGGKKKSGSQIIRRHIK